MYRRNSDILQYQTFSSYGIDRGCLSVLADCDESTSIVLGLLVLLRQPVAISLGFGTFDNFRKFLG